MAMSAHALNDIIGEMLVYLSEDRQVAEEFFQTSGFPTSALSTAIKDAGFQACLVDFMMQDDQRVLAFSARFGRPPRDLMAAHALLSGPGSYGWAVD